MKELREHKALNNQDFNNIKTAFNSIASVYDENRRKLIPCFDDLYSIPVSLIQNRNGNKKLKALDIGAGTGLFASFLLEKYPDARVTLIDMAEDMLNVAKRRFEGNGNIKYITADYSRYGFSENFDAVISAMSIHHLADAEKRRLFKKIYGLLNTGGIFVNAEQVMGETPELDALYRKLWEETIRKNGVPEKEILAWKERLKLDREATAEAQVKWLNKAGFSTAGCPYKYFKFAVIFGVKK
ncbi:MAG: methyltransferase domain-containing protein [Deltaproteobacteria bacterium]|jgi:tRNA (cmo5U34)-methyltransferase|nr:methyltransferase domain-containing protein [Deltaproteobacteria bacterium]MCL5879738.1 methyltransferase domain-containing protein [Deltaproteobacteria bacterium]MDA8304167.1 methyltransferase domain-containing protein [Deltaproteobacteria bacterium]